MSTGSEAARALAAMRRQVEKTCDVCGHKYSGTVRADRTTQYCSARCRQKAVRLRRAARAQAAAPPRQESAA